MRNLLTFAIAAVSAVSIAQSLTADQIIDDIRSSQGKDRYSAFDELGKLGPSALPIVVKLMHDSDKNIAWSAPFLAVNVHTREVLPLLAQRLKDEKDETDLSTLILAVGNHGNPMAVPMLLPYLKSANVYVRSNTCYALGHLGDPSTIPALRPLANDPNESVRICAHQAIADIKSIEAKYPGRLTSSNAWWLSSAPPAPATYPYKDRAKRKAELQEFLRRSGHQSQLGGSMASQWNGDRPDGD